MWDFLGKLFEESPAFAGFVIGTFVNIFMARPHMRFLRERIGNLEKENKELKEQLRFLQGRKNFSNKDPKKAKGK